MENTKEIVYLVSNNVKIEYLDVYRILKSLLGNLTI